MTNLFWNDFQKRFCDDGKSDIQRAMERDHARNERRKPSRAVADEVLRERFRQIESEGWTPEHDDEHDDGEIPHAAACYALMAGGTFAVDSLWPKDWGELKAKPQRRMLVVAAALLLAEIERIDRQARRDPENNDDDDYRTQRS